MSEFLEMQEEGTLCKECGAYAGEAVGYPRLCRPCKNRHYAKRNKKKNPRNSQGFEDKK